METTTLYHSWLTIFWADHVMAGYTWPCMQYSGDLNNEHRNSGNFDLFEIQMVRYCVQ